MTLCSAGDVDSQLMSLARKLEREIIDDHQNTKESNDHILYVIRLIPNHKVDPMHNGGNDTLLYPSLCWNDQHKEPMIDTKIIEMDNELANDNRKI